jgi:hypothetical protein
MDKAGKIKAEEPVQAKVTQFKVKIAAVNKDYRSLCHRLHSIPNWQRKKPPAKTFSGVARGFSICILARKHSIVKLARFAYAEKLAMCPLSGS